MAGLHEHLHTAFPAGRGGVSGGGAARALPAARRLVVQAEGLHAAGRPVVPGLYPGVAMGGQAIFVRSCILAVVIRTNQNRGKGGMKATSPFAADPGVGRQRHALPLRPRRRAAVERRPRRRAAAPPLPLLLLPAARQ